LHTIVIFLRQRMYFFVLYSLFSTSILILLFTFATSNIKIVMPQKELELLSFHKMKELVDEHNEKKDFSFLSPEFAMIHFNGAQLGGFLTLGTPYNIDNIRITYIQNGEMDVDINLVRHTLVAGDFAYLGEGSLMEIERLSDDFEMIAMTIDPQFLYVNMNGHLPSSFVGGVHDIEVNLQANDAEIVDGLIGCIWNLVHRDTCSNETIGALLTALFHHVNFINMQSAKKEVENRTREQDVFERFIALVNENCKHEHNLSFYADKLFVTQNYLGRIIKTYSGKTPKEWIDKAVIMEAKVMLKHTDMPINQIADALNYDNFSFFCRYFRRLTGMSPQQYRVS